MATGPKASFDVTKLLKEFDPSKVVSEFSTVLKQYDLSGIVDPDSLVASQKKNLEALVNANRALFEGMQAVAKRQAEILQETMNEASNAINEVSKMGSPPEVVAKQAELTKRSFERSLANMRDLAEMISKANQEANTSVNVRILASLDEIKEFALEIKRRKPEPHM